MKLSEKLEDENWGELPVFADWKCLRERVVFSILVMCRISLEQSSLKRVVYLWVENSATLQKQINIVCS